MVDVRYQRRVRLVLVYLILLVPWIAYGAIEFLASPTNSPLDWVTSEFPAKGEYERLVDDFGTGDTLLVSWPECTVGNPKVARFVESLRNSPGFFRNEQWLFDSVVTAMEQIDASIPRDPSFSPPLVHSQIPSILLGPDGESTSVLIGFNADGIQLRREVFPLIRVAAVRFGGAKFSDLHFAGPVYDGYAVDFASQQTVNRWAPISSVIVFIVCVWSLRSLGLGAVVFVIATLAQALSLAMIYYSGGEMTALLVVLPPLIQVLAISGGIHFVNYSLESVQQCNIEHGGIASASVWDQAVTQALKIGVVPCILSAATTAIGLGSLAVSGLESVRQFGIYSAIGVVATAGLILGLLPIALRIVGPMSGFTTHFSVSPSWDGLLQWVTRFHREVVVFATLLLALLIVGVSQLDASVQIRTLFSDRSRLISDYDWIEQRLGPTVPIDFVVEFRRQSLFDANQRLRFLSSLKSDLLGQNGILQVYTTRHFESDGAGDRYRLTAYLSALGGEDYGVMLVELRRFIKEKYTSNPSILIHLSGVMPLVQDIQRQLLLDLRYSFLAAFVLISLVMIIMRAGFFEGLLAMIPNVFPSLTLFGALGWAGFEIDIGTMMTACVAMGIAVDDTLHFLSCFDRQLSRGGEVAEALLTAYRSCGRAMVQTTMVCCMGLAVFALSDFLPTARFAWMMVVLLSLAVAGDLIVLPSFLLVFRRQKRSNGEGVL